MATRSEFRTASPDDLAVIKRLLAEASLPYADLEERQMRYFIVCYDGSELIATGGIEQHGRAALLRSVVVSGKARGSGLGRTITKELETRAKAAGVRTLYLLTTTAATFFPRLGYELHDRATVPASIASSTEFASLCPASAVCLAKRLA